MSRESNCINQLSTAGDRTVAALKNAHPDYADGTGRAIKFNLLSLRLKYGESPLDLLDPFFGCFRAAAGSLSCWAAHAIEDHLARRLILAQAQEARVP